MKLSIGKTFKTPEHLLDSTPKSVKGGSKGRLGRFSVKKTIQSALKRLVGGGSKKFSKSKVSELPKKLIKTRIARPLTRSDSISSIRSAPDLGAWSSLSKKSPDTYSVKSFKSDESGAHSVKSLKQDRSDSESVKTVDEGFFDDNVSVRSFDSDLSDTLSTGSVDEDFFSENDQTSINDLTSPVSLGVYDSHQIQKQKDIFVREHCAAFIEANLLDVVKKFVHGQQQEIKLLDQLIITAKKAVLDLEKTDIDKLEAFVGTDRNSPDWRSKKNDFQRFLQKEALTAMYTKAANETTKIDLPERPGEYATAGDYFDEIGEYFQTLATEKKQTSEMVRVPTAPKPEFIPEASPKQVKLTKSINSEEVASSNSNTLKKESSSETVSAEVLKDSPPLPPRQSDINSSPVSSNVESPAIKAPPLPPRDDKVVAPDTLTVEVPAHPIPSKSLDNLSPSHTSPDAGEVETQTETISFDDLDASQETTTPLISADNLLDTPVPETDNLPPPLSPQQIVNDEPLTSAVPSEPSVSETPRTGGIDNNTVSLSEEEQQQIKEFIEGIDEIDPEFSSVVESAVKDWVNNGHSVENAINGLNKWVSQEINLDGFLWEQYDLYEDDDYQRLVDLNRIFIGMGYSAATLNQINTIIDDFLKGDAEKAKQDLQYKFDKIFGFNSEIANDLKSSLARREIVSVLEDITDVEINVDIVPLPESGIKAKEDNPRSNLLNAIESFGQNGEKLKKVSKSQGNPADSAQSSEQKVGEDKSRGDLLSDIEKFSKSKLKSVERHDKSSKPSNPLADAFARAIDKNVGEIINNDDRDGRDDEDDDWNDDADSAISAKSSSNQPQMKGEVLPKENTDSPESAENISNETNWLAVSPKTASELIAKFTNDGYGPQTDLNVVDLIKDVRGLAGSPAELNVLQDELESWQEQLKSEGNTEFPTQANQLGELLNSLAENSPKNMVDDVFRQSIQVRNGE